MKRIIILIGVFIVCTFVSCEKVIDDSMPLRIISICSGENIENLYLYHDELRAYRYQRQELSSVGISVNSKYSCISIHLSPSKNSNDNYIDISSSSDLYHDWHSAWVKSHYKDFEAMDLAGYFRSVWIRKFPIYGHLGFAYLKIKSAKLYSPNQEVAGRPAGTDLSDLFNCIFHPRLCSYPDCSFSYPAYCEPGGEVLTLSDVVKYQLIPQLYIRLTPMFNISTNKLNSTHFCIEMTLEDDICGERTFTAETIN